MLCPIFHLVARALARCSFFTLQLCLVHPTARSQPTLFVRFVTKSWIRKCQFWSHRVSQLLHCSTVSFIIHVPLIRQDQCTTRMQSPARGLTLESVLTEHFGLDRIKPFYQSLCFVNFAIFIKCLNFSNFSSCGNNHEVLNRLLLRNISTHNYATFVLDVFACLSLSSTCVDLFSTATHGPICVS